MNQARNVPLGSTLAEPSVTEDEPRAETLGWLRVTRGHARPSTNQKSSFKAAQKKKQNNLH